MTGNDKFGVRFKKSIEVKGNTINYYSYYFKNSTTEQYVMKSFFDIDMYLEAIDDSSIKYEEAMSITEDSAKTT